MRRLGVRTMMLLGGAALMGLAICLAGCISARRGEPTEGPLKTTPPHVASGQQAFMRYCNPCHPGGDAGVGPALNNKPLPGFMIKTQVRLGMGKMPRFSRKEIPPSELSQIVAYLKAQRRR